jgi:lipoprotein-anchoring transpeptidase ErfK/SrfK
MRVALVVISVAVAVAPLDLVSTTAAATGVQEVLVLDSVVTARVAPAPGARPRARVAAVRPLTGSPTALPVVAERLGPDGRRWLEVRLPARPNRSVGWVPEDSGHVGRTAWQIVVDRSERRAVVLEEGKRRAAFPVVVGTSATPSPLGTFFVTEKLHLGWKVEQGPWALATSAFSDVLGEFAGGPGQIALHGRVGLPDPLGTAASHGCIRFGNAAITWLAARIPNGTPLVIRR